MNLRFIRIAGLPLLAAAVLLGGVPGTPGLGRAAAQNNSLFAVEQQQPAATPAEAPRTAAGAPGHPLAGYPPRVTGHPLAGPKRSRSLT